MSFPQYISLPGNPSPVRKPSKPRWYTGKSFGEHRHTLIPRAGLRGPALVSWVGSRTGGALEEGRPAGPGDGILAESSAQTSKWRPQHRSGVRGPVPFLLALLLLAPALPRAAAVPPTDLAILFDGTPDTVVYVNGSTVEAWAILNFTGPPDPPPLLGDIAFQWRAPNGTVVATATVHPDANGSAIS